MIPDPVRQFVGFEIVSSVPFKTQKEQIKKHRIVMAIASLICLLFILYIGVFCMFLHYKTTIK
jgi:hypothetical protein